MGLLFRRATLDDGRCVDVRVLGATVASVAAAGTLTPEGTEEVLDLDGWLLLPAPAEPHAHLDKALTAGFVANPAGDLPGAVAAWGEFRRSLGAAGIAERAERAAWELVASGATAIRTHVDVGEGIGVVGLEALLAVRDRLAGIADVQLVALASAPTSGSAGAANARWLAEAVAMGVDVVGGCPHLDPDPVGCLEVCAGIAAGAGLPLDLHMDETLDPAMLVVRDLAAWVARTGFCPRATASHCVSLGMQPPALQAEVAAELAAAGLGVVTLPHTNLYLQGRHEPRATPRGLTALRALLDAGVVVAGGGDNVQDPFNPVGRSDPFDVAALLVIAGHIAPSQAWHLVCDGARAVMGLPAVRVEPGAPAELLAVRASSVRAAIAAAPPDRVVCHDGAIVARTASHRTLGTRTKAST